MKYEFKQIDNDTTELSYKDKKFTIKRDVELMKELQSATFKAKRKMIIDLGKEGITENDLIIKKVEGNKTIEDKRNIVALENEYIQEATMKLFDDLCIKYFDMSMSELMLDIGVLGEKESEAFGVELATALTGLQQNTTPREFAKTLK